MKTSARSTAAATAATVEAERDEEAVTGPHLGVNIDHIATLRQLRKTPYPSLLEAARIVEAAGGEQITVHLREDRRHIQDEDVKQLRAELRVPLNLEMAATDAMVRFAGRIRPDWSCLVPEKRQEVTTEGGLNVVKHRARVGKAAERLKKFGIRVSLFIEPDTKAIQASRDVGADAVELHTGRFCLATQGGFGARSASVARAELERIRKASVLGRKLGLRVHAGHGFDYENVRPVAALQDTAGSFPRPLIEEFNIGHAIVCRAAIVGLERAVREMVSAILAP
jgi:pyridoxine 5-phosphate synthase